MEKYFLENKIFKKPAIQTATGKDNHRKLRIKFSLLIVHVTHSAIYADVDSMLSGSITDWADEFYAGKRCQNPAMKETARKKMSGTCACVFDIKSTDKKDLAKKEKILINVCEQKRFFCSARHTLETWNHPDYWEIIPWVTSLPRSVDWPQKFPDKASYTHSTGNV